MKKKILAISLVVAMLAIAVIGGTLAYFTDEDAADNVFTMGSVDIELYESRYHRQGMMDADTSNDGKVYTDDEIIADAETYQDQYLAVQGKDIVPGRIVMKNPYIKNTGKSAAYVRTRVILDAGLLDIIDINFTQTAINNGEMTMAVSQPDANGKVTATFTYTEPLEPGEMTYWNCISNFMIPTDLDQADVLAYQNLQNIIRVEADAIQAETFADATAAFAAFDAQN